MTVVGLLPGLASLERAAIMSSVIVRTCCCRGESGRNALRLVVAKEDDLLPLGNPVVSASKLEQWLTRQLAIENPNDNEEDVVLFALRYDAHWLKCEPLKVFPLMTLLGIYEEEGNPELPVKQTYWNAIVDKDEQVSCACQPLHSEWKRSSAVSSHIPSLTSNNETYRLQWIDFRSISEDELTFLSNPLGVWHCLTSLLGNQHWNNPWVTTQSIIHEEDPSSSPQMIVLILPRAFPTLRDFRVSDACPAWFFHGYAYMEEWQGSSSSSVLYMFKRLKSRVRLSHRHPVDNRPVPEELPGTLWEMTPPNKDEDDEDCDEKKKGEIKEKLSQEPTYHLVSPPYLNLEQEYGSTLVNALFSKDALDIFRQEALAIPQWTPWPETQHYSVGPNGEVTWTVFPLCYCFPAHDVTRRTWVEQTRHFCPRTCHLLESVLGDTLRTALFSQLKPETVLEAHTGWADLANSVLRLHIPLIVPKGGGCCGTWVDGCVEMHETGRPLLFDDSKIHRAFNYHPTQARIVLIVDLARPESLPAGRATGGHSDELDQFIAQMNVPK